LSRQIKIGLTIELLILLGLWSLGFGFWKLICDGNLNNCFQERNIWSELGFLSLSTFRPFFFSPLIQTAYIGGSSFGVVLGTFLTAFGAALSAMTLYYPGRYIGQKLIRPWLSANLPLTWQLLRTQDYKIIFFTRWIPIFPFDVCSLLYGAAGFHARRVFIFTFLGCLPEVFFLTSIAEDEVTDTVLKGLQNLGWFALITLSPLVVYEYVQRKRGASLWTRLKKVYYELLYEARVNNEIVKRHQYSADRIPVILLYGFGSSRKTLNVMETLLMKKGFEVMSFNLGGSLGVFFTRGIPETAQFIDRKIQRQMKRYGFKKVSLVAHSKGGLVAIWWLLRLGGSAYCDKLITLGTPFRGSWLTWLAIVTPLGFFWKDVWQMRPGSSFLKELHASPSAPGLKIYNVYSNRDRVAGGLGGVFQHPSDVTPIPFHHVAHYAFLGRRDIAHTIVKILGQERVGGEPRRRRDIERGLRVQRSEGQPLEVS
jgi:uncharacterized membrane protein YdjX (TVP38/TMEM64 family)/pimeloyl-ACP methyl ester carboxylesterase